MYVHKHSFDNLLVVSYMYIKSFQKYAYFLLVCNHRAQGMQSSLSPQYTLSWINNVIMQHSEVISQKYCFKIINFFFIIISFHGQSCGVVQWFSTPLLCTFCMSLLSDSHVASFLRGLGEVSKDSVQGNGFQNASGGLF